jgi:hypothetical protein
MGLYIRVIGERSTFFLSLALPGRVHAQWAGFPIPISRAWGGLKPAPTMVVQMPERDDLNT